MLSDRGRSTTARVGLAGGLFAWCAAVVVLTSVVQGAAQSFGTGFPSPDVAVGGLAAAGGLVLLSWTALVATCAVAASLLPS
jgi:hypothetical protein